MANGGWEFEPEGLQWTRSTRQDTATQRSAKGAQDIPDTL